MNPILVRLAIVVVATGFAGCGKGDKPSPARADPEVKAQPTSKLTAENYLKVKEGMQSDEVLLLLGSPSETKQFGSQFHREWKEGDRSIYVVSENGKVTSKWQVGLN